MLRRKERRRVPAVTYINGLDGTWQESPTYVHIYMFSLLIVLLLRERRCNNRWARAGRPRRCVLVTGGTGLGFSSEPRHVYRPGAVRVPAQVGLALPGCERLSLSERGYLMLREWW